MKRRTLACSALHIGIFLWLMLVFSAAWPAVENGRALFEKRCSACHQLPDPDKPPPEGWAEKLAVMAPLARLTGGQRDAILNYLTTHHQDTIKAASLQEDRVFFEQKCSLCHTLDRIFLEPLTDESRRHVVSRMQSKSGTGWLSDEDVERVLNYLSAALFDVPTPSTLAADAGADELFAARCQACHTMERIAAHLGPDHEMDMDWAHVVSRMRGKAPQWITDAESEQIINYLNSLSTPGDAE